MKDWEYQGKKVSSIEDVPKGAIGFIYKLTDENGKFYVGKKALYSVTNPEVSQARWKKAKDEGIEVTRTKNRAKSGKGKTVWRYKLKNFKKETNWKTYHGSNQEIIKLAKKQEFSREILRFCFSKSELTLREVEEQFKKEVLFRCDCYNENILGKFFKQVKC